MSILIDDLRRTIEFRQRLVAYMSSVLEHGSRRYGAPMDDDARSSLAAEKVWLAQEYGRLFAVINRWGGMGLGSQAFGLSSRDAVSDAIHNVGDGFYGDLARVTQQHLDTVIGRLRAELEGRSSNRRRPSPPHAHA